MSNWVETYNSSRIETLIYLTGTSIRTNDKMIINSSYLLPMVVDNEEISYQIEMAMRSQMVHAPPKDKSVIDSIVEYSALAGSLTSYNQEDTSISHQLHHEILCSCWFTHFL